MLSLFSLCKKSLKKKEPFAYEEGGTNVRFLFWPLLMNLKNSYLSKNCTSGTNKKRKNLIFTMLYFLEK